MRVWIVNPYDNLPLEGYRPQRFWLMARAFAKAGCATTLWTSGFSHANKRVRKTVSEGVYDGFQLRLVKTPGYRANIGLGRIIDHWVLARRWRRMAGAAERPDLIVVSSPPLSLVGAVRKFAQERGIPYIVDVMDAWPETFERVVPRFVLKALGLYRVARRNYLGAARISVVARRYEELVRSYGYRGDVREFLHGIERSGCRGCQPLPSQMVPSQTVKAVGPDVPYPPAQQPEGATRRGAGRTLQLVYVGNMSLSYDLETLIRAVLGMNGVTLDLAGDGPDRARLEGLVSRVEMEKCRIRFLGYLGAAELSEVLRSADVGVVPMFTASCVGVPYKLADYAAAGLPVVNSLEGETAELLARYGAGFSYRAGDVASLCRAIEQLKASDLAALSRGSVHLADLFDAKKIYADYESWACRE